MQKKHEILWTETAEKDLISIIDFIAAENFLTAQKLLLTFKQSADTLSHLPFQGRIVPELKNQGVHLYKELILLHWRLIYRVSDDAAIILSVIDSRRNAEDILLERFYS